MSNNSLRVRPYSRTRRLSRDHESPKYTIAFECILQIHSETQQTLSEAHADVKTTDNYMLRMFAIGFTKKRQTKITSQNCVKKTWRKKSKIFNSNSKLDRLGVDKAYPHRTTNVTANSSGQSLIQITLSIPRQKCVQHKVFQASPGLAGSTKVSRSIPSAMRVAVSMKVSMRSLNRSFLVLATSNAFSFSSRASL